MVYLFHPATFGLIPLISYLFSTSTKANAAAVSSSSSSTINANAATEIETRQDDDPIYVSFRAYAGLGCDQNSANPAPEQLLITKSQAENETEMKFEGVVGSILLGGSPAVRPEGVHCWVLLAGKAADGSLFALDWSNDGFCHSNSLGFVSYSGICLGAPPPDCANNTCDP